jgi:hypothetical protein
MSLMVARRPQSRSAAASFGMGALALGARALSALERGALAASGRARRAGAVFGFTMVRAWRGRSGVQLRSLSALRAAAVYAVGGAGQKRVTLL